MNVALRGVRAVLPPICFTAASTFVAYQLWGWWSLPFLALAGIGAVDTYFRWQEYVRLRDWFADQADDGLVFGVFSRVLSRHKYSWCRRRLACHAIRAYDPDGHKLSEWAARSFYEEQGYRWWHILPDGFPAAFFKASFWRGLVGRQM